MNKTYSVYGANWWCEVELQDVETLPIDSIKIEAATRAVEAFYGKRDDIETYEFDPSAIDENVDELHATILQLLKEELEPDCGIGMLMSISDGKDEWYINSKSILENVGVPSLVEKFDQKYPDKKKQTS
jgi:hypothetical protein